MSRIQTVSSRSTHVIHDAISHPRSIKELATELLKVVKANEEENGDLLKIAIITNSGGIVEITEVANFLGIDVKI